ncbi:Cyclic-di-AMP phosphodiesterase PgpH [Acaryochloris thomasi RCC1774]|uniref:Cyclic-di-AMP phosphodiesterase PgpH n=1 Tax=Acaryochloris thomasi RCC1774 TaxID=1764569 RepID=A0A2W1JWS3_9CYAN|nr:HDIG domain-containing metalloprotein [Acaryochloris thomasi]PZD73151.1 Cyclic-di-AMP phosphodiesterase PgpH [Acaryochloris thomasi RCC1774]
MKPFRFQKLDFIHWWSATSNSASKESACVRQSAKTRSPILLITISIAALTGTIGHRFYNEPKLAIGTPAPQTIRAPADATVEDQLATEAARKEASQSSLSIFMVNQAQTRQIKANFKRTLAEVQKTRQAAGPLPYVDPGVLSTSVQVYLRRMDSTDFQALRKELDRRPPQRPEQPSLEAQKAWEQLLDYRDQDSEDLSWSQLMQRLSQAQRRYQTAVRESRLPASEIHLILSPVDQVWKDAPQQLTAVQDRMLAQGIPPGLPPQVLRQAIQLNLADLNPDIQAAGMPLLRSLLMPNLSIDPAGTLRQREQAAQTVQPVTVSVTEGETIVTAGAPITQANFVLLDHFGLSKRGINGGGLALMVTLVSGAIAIFWLIQTRVRPSLSRRDYILILLLSLTVPLIPWAFELSYASLPAVGLLVGSFYGSILGATVIILLTALMPLGLGGGLSTLLAIAAGSLVGSIFASRPRAREELALLGLVVAVTQGLTAFVLLTATGVALASALGTAALQGLIGMGWSVIALGVSPYLENLFDLVTPIRLAELANPNRPLLKRLAQEAPGTFQHTLFVATLAEAGARALGGNVELVRTGTLYHDIGKMHDAQAFIENQMQGKNLHEQLNDPWQSADIIIKHVTEGLVMARRCRLPKAVRAFIPEHQGTMAVAYFHHQAQEIVANDPEREAVNEADFRYAGPIPQSRETGIVMLADSCEAALRSLKDATPDTAKQTVNKIFKARWQDEQLVDSQLTRENLNTLLDVFIDVWMQFHHKRIPYPMSNLPTIGRQNM